MTSILPPNATKIEQAVEALAVHVRDLDVPIRHLWNPHSCPAAFLPWLAWAWSVDFWRSDWPEATKRGVIAASPRVHRLKGTVSSLKAALGAIAGASSIRLVEWFQDGGSGIPYTATIEIDVTHGAAPELPYDALAAANASKRESVHLDLRLIARPRSDLVSASLIRRPISHARLSLSNDLRPSIGGGLAAAGLIRRPVAYVALTGNFA